MGTKIYRESYLPEYQYPSARNTNETPTSSNWPMFFGNKLIQNGQHCNGILLGNVANLFSGYEKDAIKQMMLTHEAAFKHQVSELHRVYKVQKEIMSEIKRKELYKHQIPIETPPPSSSLVHREPQKDVGIPVFGNLLESNDCEILDSRPSKARKRLFDLQLPADTYIDVEEEILPENKKIDVLGNSCLRKNRDDLGISASLDSKVQLFDLNEPFRDDDVDVASIAKFLEKSKNGSEQILYVKGKGHIVPNLDVTASPIHTHILYSQSEVGHNLNTTFSKLLSDEILKAKGPCENEGINTTKDANSSHLYDPAFSHNKVESKTELIDINIISEVENEERASDFGGHIDLNVCASEDEITILPSCTSTSNDAKIVLDIDLEEKFAGMAIVAMSSFEENTKDPFEGSLKDALSWFSKAISNLESDPSEIDEFEAMTLELTELEEDEYMPTPLVLGNADLETEAVPFSSRARRGKAKRQKRDFQREILPGLASLSRHEVAEDVQTFGGIMKAMGFSWPARNGGGCRGRRRLMAEVVPLAEIGGGEIGLEERVLVGWGKTPRKPRRRRSNASNLTLNALS